MRHPATTTEGFRALEKDSRARNRGPNKRLMELLDPDGVHVAGYTMIHNDCELRCHWFVKIKGQDDPVRIWMDNGFEAFEAFTLQEGSSPKD